MEITINGKKADITLDTEKNLGDILSGIEQWISSGGSRIQEVKVNGRDLSNSLTESFDLDAKKIKTLEIDVSPWRELAYKALIDLRATCDMYGNAAFDERRTIAAAWGESAAARFLASDIPDIYDLAVHTLSGEGLSAGDLAILTEERLREAADPRREIISSEPLVKSIAARMEELPLDIQTGKDGRAAETVQLFARTGEKLLRIFSILKTEGLSPDSFVIEALPVRNFIEEFNAVLKELSAAYENRDTVLVGDLAEYELAPRLLTFFTALKDFSESPSPSVPRH
ncbi:MAG: hypothetical protein FWC45_08765 [Treponema sp.]|nr:hypothetical protein [Treponema sp.]